MKTPRYASGGFTEGPPPREDNIPVLLLRGETFCPITKTWCQPCGGNLCKQGGHSPTGRTPAGPNLQPIPVRTPEGRAIRAMLAVSLKRALAGLLEERKGTKPGPTIRTGGTFPEKD